MNPLTGLPAWVNDILTIGSVVTLSISLLNQCRKGNEARSKEAADKALAAKELEDLRRTVDDHAKTIEDAVEKIWENRARLEALEDARHS